MRIALCERNQLTQGQLQNLLRDEAVELLPTEEEALITSIATQHIDVLFINILNISERVATIIHEHIPYLVVTSSVSSTETAKQAIEIGARAYFPPPYDNDELERILQKAKIFLENYKKSAIYKRKTRIISLWSAKGGIGKSTLCTNLAIELQKNLNQKVLIIDCVPYYGTIELILDMPHIQQKTLGYLPDEFATYGPEHAWRDIENIINKHPLGIEVINVGDQRWTNNNCKKLNTLLTMLKELGRYDLILIDTETSISELSVVLLEQSSQLLFVSALDIPSIKAVDTALEVIKSLYFSQDKITLIINRLEEADALAISEFEKHVGLKIAHTIPDDKKGFIIDSLNTGKPLILSELTHPFTVAVQQIATRLVHKEKDKDKDTKQTKSGFSRLFSR